MLTVAGRWIAAVVLGLLLACAHLLDGERELQAAQLTADEDASLAAMATAMRGPR